MQGAVRDMPTYEYKCKKCGHQFEEFQSITDAPLTTCPQENCRGRVFRIISTGAGFLLKGSGFYETDYRSESYKKAAEADRETKPSSSSSEKSGDTKATAASHKKPSPDISAKSKTDSAKKDT